ncbi:MAG TPA: DUF4388 domain-containing protein [Kofleriaceae bacterium]|nr:DUF4388 domain-containing protein [Kofleriaceae bacterium]
MSLRGQVGTMALEDVLEWAVRRKVTGTLTCERNGRVRALAVQNGAVEWASSSMPEEQLGQILLATGGITEDGLADALGVRNETQVPLGRILLMVGAVREEDVVTALAAKIRESVSDLVTWTDGSFELDPRPPLGGGVSAPINLDVCLTIARRRVQRWSAIRAAIPDDQVQFYARRTEPPEIDSPIDATRVWALAIASETAARIVAACGGERYAVLDHLAQLITEGALGIDRRTKPRTESATELAQGARARLRTGDRAAALEMAERAKQLAPTDPDARSAHSAAERARVAEVARTLLAKHRVPRLRRSPAEIAEMELTDVERRLVHRIDGRWDLLSLIRTASVRESEALLAIAKLAERGVVELSKP